MQLKKQKTHLFSVTKKDLEIQFFRAGGAGGQHQNKVSSACRIKHTASGAVGESRTHRSQDRNKAEAFRRMTETKTFTAWVRLQASISASEHKDIEAWLDAQMHPDNLKIETA